MLFPLLLSLVNSFQTGGEVVQRWGELGLPVLTDPIEKCGPDWKYLTGKSNTYKILQTTS